MCRKVIIIVMLGLLSLPLLYKSFVVTRYYIYFDYYAEVLCENKDFPMSQCNGQCALKKELNAAKDSKEKAETPLNWMKNFSISVFEPATIQTQIFFESILAKHLSFFIILSSQFIPLSADRPPCFG